MKIKFFATYREITKTKEISVPAPGTVWDLAALLIEKYGRPMKDMLENDTGDDFGEYAIILVNGQNIVHLEGKLTPLTEADLVTIFPPVAGG